MHNIKDNLMTKDILTYEKYYQRWALSVLEKHQICKERLDPQRVIETLAVFGAHFTDEKGEPVKTSTMSGVLKEGTERSSST